MCIRDSLQVNTEYGSLRANRLMGASNKIDVAYGKCLLGEVSNADIRMAYGALELARAEQLRLQNTYGQVNINSVADLDATLHYATGRIGELTERGNLAISYSAALTLPALAETVRQLDVTVSHTRVQLPIGTAASFDVTVSNGRLAYPAGMPITFSLKDNGQENGGTVRMYRGKVGRGGTPVRVVSSYGTVNFVNVPPPPAVPPGPKNH